MTTLEPERITYVQGQLETGETIRWTGKTNTKSRLKKLIPVILLIVLVNGSCMGLVLGMDNIYGIGAILFWVALGASIWFLQQSHLDKLIYVVTDRRALILSFNSPSKTESYSPEKLGSIQLINIQGNYGDVIFTTITNRRRGATPENHGFLATENPQQATVHLSELALSKRSSNASGTFLYDRDSMN
jgi:hypothetical protein